MLVSAIIFFGCNVLNVNPLKCVSMNNQECKIRRKIIDISNNKSSFYSYSIKVNKRGSSGNNINDPYAKLFVSDATKTKYQSIQSNFKN